LLATNGSLSVCYALFLLFGFILGAEIDIHDERSACETFFGSLPIPAMVIAFGSCSIFSIVCSIRYFRRGRREVGNQSESRKQ
jgi:hypothetical protein